MKIDAHLHLMEHLSSFCGSGQGRAIGGGKVKMDTGDIIQMVPDGMGDYGFGYRDAIKLMDANCVDKAVLMQSSFYTFQNDYVLEAAAAFPGRFHPVAALDPFCNKRDVILDNFINNCKFKALKFEVSEPFGLSSYHPGFQMDGPEMMPVYEVADANGLTLVFDLGGNTQSCYQIDAFDKLTKRFKNAKFIFCHLLCIRSKDQPGWEDDMRALKGENVWFDYSSLSYNIREPYPYPTSIYHAEKAANLVGSDRLIWGSDTPFVLAVDPYENLMNYLYESKVLNADQIDRMMADNAIDAYGIK